MDANKYTDDANSELEKAYSEPLSLEEYVEKLFTNPRFASHAAKYLLEAIQYHGTRTVIEEGEEIERYVFFDDPHNDGEHAILGNTRMLNDFVDTLQSIVSGTGKTEKMLWVYGPTATGKSEFKRCLINGLSEYSKTEEGRRFTIEWNETTSSYDPTYHGETGRDEDPQAWKQSPVQTHPLAVYPESVREALISDLNTEFSESRPTRVNQTLDPFSEEYYEFLKREYRDNNSDSLFEKITSRDHLRVVNYPVEVGQGIGILHAEDSDQQPKSRLVGSWMRHQLGEMDSKGRRNPHAFTFDGVLSQGNNLLTIIEEASQHSDLLFTFLNILDENEVKLDQQTRMDIDTVVLIISNPDLESTLNQQEDLGSKDPLKALKRRMEEHRVRYLTNHSLEAQLLRKEIIRTEDFELQSSEAFDVSEPLEVKLFESDTVYEREIAPHGLEAASMANIVSRLVETEDMPEEFDLVDKAIVFDKSYVQKDDTRYDKDDLNIPETENGNGEQGVPVTYTRDIISELLTDVTVERSHPELSVEDVILPQDILDEMIEQASETPLFSDAEAELLVERIENCVESFVFEQQKEDVLQAAMAELETSEGEIEEYLEHVYAWANDDTITDTTTGKEKDPDGLLMQLFETETLGISESDDYNSQHSPTHQSIVDFREKKIIQPLNKLTWQERGDDFVAEDVPLTDIPVLRDLLETNSIEDLKRHFDEFDPHQWNDPPEGTVTEEVKKETLDNLVELFGYSEASAELTSSLVMNTVSKQWD